MEDGRTGGKWNASFSYYVPLHTQWSRGIFEAFCLFDTALVYLTNPILIALYKVKHVPNARHYNLRFVYFLSTF